MRAATYWRDYLRAVSRRRRLGNLEAVPSLPSRRARTEGRNRMTTEKFVSHSPRSRHRTWPGLLSDRRSSLARFLFRSPICMYRVGLDWIFGHQFLLVTHMPAAAPDASLRPS